MAHNGPFNLIDDLLAEGRYQDASAAATSAKVELQKASLGRFVSVMAEVALHLGDFSLASRHCERALRESDNASIRAMAQRVLAEVAAHQLDFETAHNHFSTARAMAANGARSDVRAVIELSYWGWFSGVLPLESTATEFARVRRVVLAAGKPPQFAHLRLCTARVEARKGNVIEALRHLTVAASLLRECPNVKLQSQLWLDTCTAYMVQGDIRSALDAVDRASVFAAEAGYFRSIIGAQIDRAHVMHALGELDAARAIAETAVEAAKPYKQMSVAALDCLANILVGLNRIAEAEERFAEIANLRPSPGSKLAPHWDVLSELSSRFSLAKAKNVGTEAESIIEEGVRTAAKNGDQTWLVRMQLALAELRLNAGDIAGALEPLTHATEVNLPSPEIVARIAAIKGLTAMKEGDLASASVQYDRGKRIAVALENSALSFDVRAEVPPLDRSKPATIEDAGALLELAGYPHVLAREAYALLELAGAATSMALVTLDESGVTPVALHGWTEEEARQAAEAPSDRLVIHCGSHRDQTWEIIAELKQSLNDRCTGIAVRKLVDTAVTLDRYRREEKQRAALWPADTLETDGGLWISEQTTELLSIARRIAPADVSVLLTGETGTGKEVLARAIHRASGRGGKPFVPFNCTAVPREMLESQLFGYRKGAFTGAHNAFDGVIRAAAGGTLFLDEIAEIGPDLQPKLLRFLETREVHGLGEPQPVKVDVRVIAATNADIEALVSAGKFREDLFYRLNVVRLRVPPLRDRREEVPPLIDHYLRTFAEQQKKGRLSLDDETLEYMVLYRWPGNVRQLVNEISRIVAYAEPDSTITPALLSPEVQASRRTVRVMPGEEPEIRVRLDQQLGDAVDAIERVMVVRALERAHGNYENAARLLGISRKGLFLKRRRWGMQRQAAS